MFTLAILKSLLCKDSAPCFSQALSFIPCSFCSPGGIISVLPISMFFLLPAHICCWTPVNFSFELLYSLAPVFLFGSFLSFLSTYWFSRCSRREGHHFPDYLQFFAPWHWLKFLCIKSKVWTSSGMVCQFIFPMNGTYSPDFLYTL